MAKIAGLAGPGHITVMPLVVRDTKPGINSALEVRSNHNMQTYIKRIMQLCRYAVMPLCHCVPEWILSCLGPSTCLPHPDMHDIHLQSLLSPRLTAVCTGHNMKG